MTQTTSVRDLKGCLEPGQVDRLIAVATNPRDKAFIAVLSKSGMLISEAIEIEVGDFDFAKGTLTIANLKKRLILKCPNCHEPLSRHYVYCPICGEKISQVIQEEIEQRRHRMIPIDGDTLKLLTEYLKWRRKFSYRGSTIFPFSRQRAWQLVEKIGRRAGIKGLHPHSFRQLLVTTWLEKGLDAKQLQIFLGYVGIDAGAEDSNSTFDRLKLICKKLWEDKKDDK